MQRHLVALAPVFRVVPPLKRRLLAELPAPPRLRFLASRETAFLVVASGRSSYASQQCIDYGRDRFWDCH